MGNKLIRTFSKEEVQIAEKDMSIKEMQIKTTLRFNFTPVGIATIKNITTNKCG
jgi:hypothetical protein